MATFKSGTIVEGLASTASSGGSLALVYNSKSYQLITGTQNHTVVLPDATTCVDASSNIVPVRYEILNKSTGEVTVNLFGGTFAKTIASGTQAQFYLIDKTTSAGTWVITNEAGVVVGIATGDSIGIVASLSRGNYKDSYTTGKKVSFIPDEVGKDFWTTRTSIIGTAAGYGGGATVNGYGYRVAGLDSGSTSLSVNERVNIDFWYWTSKTALTGARYDYAIAVSKSKYIYAISGIDSSIITTAEKYIDSTNIWSSITSIAAGVQENRGFALEKVYNFGGSNPVNGSAVSTHQAYDETLNSWTSKKPTISASCGAAAFTIYGFGYKIGGNTSGNTAGSIQTNSEKYNEILDVWSTVKSLSTATDFPAVGDTSLMGVGYLLSGRAPGLVTTVLKYNPLTNYFSSAQSMSTARAAAYGMSVAGGLVVAGGGNYHSSVEQYQASAFMHIGSVKKSFASPQSILCGVSLNEAIVECPVQVRTDGNEWKTFVSNKDSILKQGETLVNKLKKELLPYWAGGTADNTNATTSMQLYNDITNTWSFRGALTTARWGHGSFSIDGKSYIVEGEDAATAVHSASSFNDFTNTWTSKTTISSTIPLGLQGFEILGFGYAVGGSTSTANYNSGQTTNYKYNPTLDSWVTKAVLPTGIAGGYSNNNRDSGVVSGGQVGPTAQTTNYRYNENSDSWATKTALASARVQGAGGCDLNGYGYAVGGSVANAEKYNPETDAWSTTSSTVVAHGSANQSAPVANGFIYAAGNGFANGTSGKYNDASNVWSSITSASTNLAYGSGSGASGSYRNYELRVGIPSFVAGLGASVWISKNNIPTAKQTFFGVNLQGVGVIAGGNNGSSLAASEIYVEEHDSWSSINSLPSAVNSCHGVVLLGFGYAVGGDGGNTHYKLDPTGYIWTTKTVVPASRYYNASFALNGYYFACGGGDSAVYRYDQAANSWATKGSLPVTLSQSRGESTLGFGYNIIGDNGSPTTSCYKYDDASDSWVTLTGIASVARSVPGTNRMNNDNILFYGGIQTVTNQPVVDEFNPITNSGTRKQDFTTRQSLQGFNLSGNVFAPGGYNGGPLATHQCYVPSKNKLIAGIALKVQE